MTKWYYWLILAIILMIMANYGPPDTRGFAIVMASVYLGVSTILKALGERHD